MNKDYSLEELERLRLTNREIQNAFEQLSALQNLSIEITGSENLEKIVQSVFSTIPHVIGCRACRVYLFKNEKFILAGEHFYNKSKNCAKVDDEVLYWSCKRGAVTVHPGEFENTGTAIAPMTLASNIIGVILLDLGTQFEKYSESTRTALTTVASHTALAIANAQTHHELREKAENLNDMNEYVDGVIASIATPILSLAPDGKITVFNKKAEEFFQIRSKIVVNNLYSVVLPNYLQEIFSKLLVQIQNNEAPQSVEVSFNTMYNEPRHALITASALNVSSSQRPGMVCICQDMALSKEVERLKELDKMKDNFISLISKELKDPLIAILENTSALLEETNESDQLQMIQQEAQRLDRLVDNILDTSKIDSGKLEFRFRPFDSAQIVNGSKEALQRWADKKQQQFIMEVEKNLPMGKGDPQRITQVLFNLLSNAIKFTPEGGKIKFGVQLSEGVWDNTIQTRLLFFVADNGKGIKPENLEAIFERFSQLENASSKYQGSGLGLSISQTIVKRHGSELKVESEWGKGTRFTFILPVAAD